VGGILQNLGTNAAAGTGQHFVIEADEYDRAFLGLKPSIAVITALEHDHPDCYPTFAEMRDTFLKFANQLLPDGLLIVCGEDAEAHQLASHVQGAGRRAETYGLDRRWDWWAEGAQLGNSAVFEVWHRTGAQDPSRGTGGRCLGTCALQVPGLHNVLNCLAALAATMEIGVEFGTAAAALTRFRGTARRFEVKGRCAGITVVDDYAHHPTEIRATLAAAQSKYPGRDIWAVFQPHTFSRTASLLAGFATAFDDAAHVVITGIYAAREENTFNVSGSDIVNRMDHPDARYAPTLDGAVGILLDQLRAGDVVITMGAGDGYVVGERLLERLNSHGMDQ
jgi:UDP-N-acetylmuramate--alanine ligase